MLRVAGWRRFDDWAVSATDEQREDAYKVLFDVCDGTDPSTRVEDVVDGTICHAPFGEGDVLSWRVTPDYPGHLQIIYVGPVEFF